MLSEELLRCCIYCFPSMGWTLLVGFFSLGILLVSPLPKRFAGAFILFGYFFFIGMGFPIDWTFTGHVPMDGLGLKILHVMWVLGWKA